MAPKTIRSPNLREGDTPIVVRLYEKPEPLYFNQGGLAQAADTVRGAGRWGDEILLHVNPEEFAQLQAQWGEPTINPHTGLPEYGFLSKLWKKVKGVVKKVAPVLSFVLPMIPGVGTVLGMMARGIAGASGLGAGAVGALTKALSGAATGAISGGGRGALAGALTGGLADKAGALGSKALGSIGLGSLAGKEALSNMVGSSLIGGGTMGLAGGDVGEGLKMGALTSAVSPIAQNALSKTGLVPASEAPTLFDDFGMGASPLSQASNNLSPVQTTAQRMSLPGGEDLVPGTSLANVELADTSAVPAGTPAPSGGSGNNEGALLALAKKYALPAALLAGVSRGGGGGEASAPQLPPEFLESLPMLDFNRAQRPRDFDYYTYGTRPEESFFDLNQLPGMPREEDEEANAAHGGSTRRLVKGPGTGRSDSIEARLSDGEYVIDAETVALLGDGSVEAGAAKLDAMRKGLRKQKGRKLARGEFSDKAHDDPLKYAGKRA